MRYPNAKSPSRSPESSSRNDPFGAYLKKGHVQFIVDNDITTVRRHYTPEKGHRRTPEERHKRSSGRRRSLKKTPSCYYCDRCPFKTRYRQDMRKHEKRHINPAYSCQACNMPFMSNGHLNGHLREAHNTGPSLNKQRMKCDLCPYTSYQRPDLRRHELRHQAKDVLHCKYCNHPFMSFKLMLIHAKKEHKTSDSNRPPIDDNRNKTLHEDNTVKHSGIKVKETVTLRKEQRNNNAACTEKNKDPQGDTDKITEEVNCPDVESNAEKETTDLNTELKSIPKKSINYLNCAFCQYVAASYGDLKEHLDVHDDDHTTLGIDCSDSSSVGEDSSADAEEFENENISEKCDMEIDADNNNNDKVEVVLPKTNIVNAADVYSTESNANTSNVSNETMQSLHSVDNENGFENITEVEYDEVNEDEHDYKDAMTIYGDCITKLTTKPKDDFIIKPFACARCFFTTGNIEHLKVHVEAHLYEKAREAYQVAKRGGVTWTDDETESRKFDKLTDTSLNNAKKKVRATTAGHDRVSNISGVCNLDTSIAKTAAELNVETNTVEDADEGFVDKYSMNKASVVCNENDKKLIPATEFIGRLRKCEFQKTKRLYRILDSDTSGVVYECLVCEHDYIFDDMNSLREHFRVKHSDLRNKICQSCKHCSKPFP